MTKLDNNIYLHMCYYTVRHLPLHNTSHTPTHVAVGMLYFNTAGISLLQAQIQIKNNEVDQISTDLQRRDEELHQKDIELQQKNEELQQKDIEYRRCIVCTAFGLCDNSLNALMVMQVAHQHLLEEKNAM